MTMIYDIVKAGLADTYRLIRYDTRKTDRILKHASGMGWMVRTVWSYFWTWNEC